MIINDSYNQIKPVCKEDSYQPNQIWEIYSKHNPVTTLLCTVEKFIIIREDLNNEIEEMKNAPGGKACISDMAYSIKNFINYATEKELIEICLFIQTLNKNI